MSAPTDGPTSEHDKKPSLIRRAAPFLLVAVAVIVALAIVFVRGADGPLKLQNTGGGEVAAAALGDRVAATVEVTLPAGKDAKITAVRTSVGSGLRIVEDYVAAPEAGASPKAAYLWKGFPAEASGQAKPKQPGAFAVTGGSGARAVVTAVARTTRTGRTDFSAVEVDYSIGSARHRKRFKVDFGVCVNAKGTQNPVATACKAAPAD